MSDSSSLSAAVTVGDLVAFADAIAWSVVGLVIAFTCLLGVVLYFSLRSYVDARLAGGDSNG